MASLVYNSFLNDLVKGNINPNSDTFKCMLLTSSYTPDKDTHAKRSNLTNEVSGTGYTTGGASCTVTVSSLDTANDRQEFTLGAVSWSTATITARYAVVYKARGGASSADELVALIDFGGNITSTADTFSLSASTIRFQN